MLRSPRHPLNPRTRSGIRKTRTFCVQCNGTIILTVNLPSSHLVKTASRPTPQCNTLWTYNEAQQAQQQHQQAQRQHELPARAHSHIPRPPLASLNPGAHPQQYHDPRTYQNGPGGPNWAYQPPFNAHNHPQLTAHNMYAAMQRQGVNPMHHYQHDSLSPHMPPGPPQHAPYAGEIPHDPRYSAPKRPASPSSLETPAKHATRAAVVRESIFIQSCGRLRADLEREEGEERLKEGGWADAEEEETEEGCRTEGDTGGGGGRLASKTFRHSGEGRCERLGEAVARLTSSESYS
ncbi:hypothetical protein C8F01DRAFT_1081020 [Mycena amicta]|nr:hypothetical protein C8F01DRAFT_1081020 [Mycena amicta]